MMNHLLNNQRREIERGIRSVWREFAMNGEVTIGDKKFRWESSKIPNMLRKWLGEIGHDGK